MEFSNLRIKYILLFWSFIFTINSFSQGKHAGEFKAILGQKYLTEKDIPPLKSFKYVCGSIISDSVNSYYLSLEVFKNGTTAVVVLNKLIDKVAKKHSVIEVLKLVDVQKDYEIRISGCTAKNKNPDDIIVAVYYTGRNKKIKLIKESYVLKDIRFEKIDAKTVKCINEI